MSFTILGNREIIEKKKLNNNCLSWYRTVFIEEKKST